MYTVRSGNHRTSGTVLSQATSKQTRHAETYEISFSPGTPKTTFRKTAQFTNILQFIQQFLKSSEPEMK